MTGARAEFKELELVMESGGLHEVLSSLLNRASTFSDYGGGGIPDPLIYAYLHVLLNEWF